MPEQSLYTAAQTRELDRIAIEEFGIPGIQLMARAGRAAFELYLSGLAEDGPEQLAVFCGTGNNGGDGFVIAALAQSRRIPVCVYQVGDAGKITGDAALARQQALDAGVEMINFEPGLELDSCVVIDALLGTGLSGDVRGDYLEAIELINASDCPVLAIDIPSGLCSDSGRCLGSAILAELTVTFIGVKQGLLTGVGSDYCGDLHFADLEVPAEVYQQLQPASLRLDLDLELDLLPAFALSAHKGVFGHALVVGGDYGMAGAALMAAEAAARCGAGLVSAATRPEHVAALVSRRPEIMACPVNSRSELEPLLERAAALAVGPGLGHSPWSEQLLQRCLETSLPLVLDADGLNLLAAGLLPQAIPRDNWILTPHPGEAARLLQCSTADIQADRFAAVRDLQARFGGVVLLKGAGTLVCDGEQVYVCPYGNPGMASGGMGDVLSGVLASLLAQGLSPSAAARLGVCLHSAAADLAAADGVRGLLATDLMPWLRDLVDG
ncbi:MAG: NAD(P)H-hydrate dehydratase [Halieaceae bacterium]